MPGQARGEILAGPMRDTVFETELAASPVAIRATLAELRDRMAAAGMAAALLSRVEMVLAEVLNNVAQHAYAGDPCGRVRLRACLSRRGVCVAVCDTGGPMPQGAPPAGHLPDPSVPRDSLPEGGFGWYLIHDQTDSIRYRRAHGTNHLKLFFRRDGGR